MKLIFFLVALVPTVFSASIGSDERLALLLKYSVQCAEKSGVSVFSLLQLSTDDPAFNEYLSCFAEKYFSDNTRVAGSNIGNVLNLPVISSYSHKCAVNSKISLSSLIQIADENPPEDDAGYKKYMSCYLVKLGVLTQDGDIGEDVTKVEKWLLSGSAKKVLDRAKNNCGDNKKTTLEETAVAVFRCMKKHNEM